MKRYEYEKARNKVWEAIIECNLTKLPIDLKSIYKHYGITAIPYSKFNGWDLVKEEAKDGDGFSIKINEKCFIVFNEKNVSRGRLRFTIAHEIGHILLGHLKK